MVVRGDNPLTLGSKVLLVVDMSNGQWMAHMFEAGLNGKRAQLCVFVRESDLMPLDEWIALSTSIDAVLRRHKLYPKRGALRG